MSLLDTIKKKIKQSKSALPAREIRTGAGGKKRDVSAPSVGRVSDQENRPATMAGSALAEGAKSAHKDRARTGASLYHKKRALDMLLHPYITEKAAGLKAVGNKYVFMVVGSANKIEIRKVIQEKFKVTVTKINIINIPRRSIRVGLTLGTKPGFKKAIITLKEGNTIETGV